MKRLISILILVLSMAVLLASCGGGGGGGGGTSLQPPAANITGTWQVTQTKSSDNPLGCHTLGGNSSQKSITYTLNIQETTGSNNFTATDPSTGESSPGTISGTVTTINAVNTPSGSGSGYDNWTDQLTLNVSNMTASGTQNGVWSSSLNGPVGCTWQDSITATCTNCTSPPPPGGPPSVPSNLTVTAASSSQIDLSWSASTGSVAGYKIYRGGSFLKQVSSTSTSDTGLTASTQYCYTVSAYDAANNESAQSSQQCATTLTTTSAPAAPSNVSATNITQTSATLSWTDNSNNETGFKIGTCSLPYCSDIGCICKAGFTEAGRVGANVTSYSLTGLSPSTSYRYYILAYNSAGSASSLGIDFRTADPAPGARYLRVINDLYDQVAGTNDWPTWNTIIRVRIATTQYAVENDTTNTYERLYKGDSTCSVSNLYDIPPAYQQTTSYVDFDVNSMPANYYVYIQTGWWDFDAWTFCWDKHMTAVTCCDCANACYKWRSISVSGHTSGRLDIKASQFLPQFSWCNSGPTFCQ